MSNQADGLGDRLRFIEGLVDEHATVAGDVFEIDEHTWAIHGTIPVDGDVLMAEFASERDAVAVLEQLRRQRGPGGSPGS